MITFLINLKKVSLCYAYKCGLLMRLSDLTKYSHNWRSWRIDLNSIRLHHPKYNFNIYLIILFEITRTTYVIYNIVAIFIWRFSSRTWKQNCKYSSCRRIKFKFFKAIKDYFLQFTEISSTFEKFLIIVHKRKWQQRVHRLKDQESSSTRYP